jgi:hypothetical protein
MKLHKHHLLRVYVTFHHFNYLLWAFHSLCVTWHLHGSYVWRLHWRHKKTICERNNRFAREIRSHVIRYWVNRPWIILKSSSA